MYMMVLTMRKSKGRAAIRTSDHLLLTSNLPNFSVALALIEYAYTSRE
jgi:hypothetical protein